MKLGCLRDGLTACTVKEAIAGFDGVIDLIGAGVIVDFPKPDSSSRYCGPMEVDHPTRSLRGAFHGRYSASP